MEDQEYVVQLVIAKKSKAAKVDRACEFRSFISNLNKELDRAELLLGPPHETPQQAFEARYDDLAKLRGLRAERMFAMSDRLFIAKAIYWQDELTPLKDPPDLQFWAIDEKLSRALVCDASVEGCSNALKDLAKQLADFV